MPSPPEPPDLICGLVILMSVAASPSVYLAQGRMADPASMHTPSLSPASRSVVPGMASAGSQFIPSPPKEEARVRLNKWLAPA